MKKIYLTAIISLSLLILSDGLRAQSTLTKLNQAELIKQLTGNWKGDVGKDTTAFWEIKYSDLGLECNFKFVSKDKTVMEGKQLWAYNKKTDKFILSSMTGMDSGTHGLWFISKSKYLIVPSEDISNPEKASFKLEGEFKSPDIFIQKSVVNNKIVKTDTFNRVKK
jgi:hypothetical protein